MSYVATMGTSSCATIAVGGFKEGQRENNEKYKADKASLVLPKEGQSVEGFYNNTLYPTTQPLGRSYELPFEKVMEDIEACGLKTKFIIATLNIYQYNGNSEYWPNELNRWGFKLVSKTNNSIGSINYIYVRNPNVVAIEDGEH